MWGWGGGGGVFFLHLMLFPTFLEKINSGNKKQNIFLFTKTIIVDRDSGNLYPIYVKKKKKIVVLASEPVGGRSRATELPCWFSAPLRPLYWFSAMGIHLWFWRTYLADRDLGSIRIMSTHHMTFIAFLHPSHPFSSNFHLKAWFKKINFICLNRSNVNWEYDDQNYMIWLQADLNLTEIHMNWHNCDKIGLPMAYIVVA